MEKDRLTEKVERLEKDMGKLSDKIDRFDEWKQAQDLNNLQNIHDLKDLIKTAVEEGQKVVLSEIEKIKARLEILEDRDKNEALKKEQEKKEDKKTLYKHIRNIAISCIITLVITFFGTILLNNLMTTKSFEDKFNEQMKYYDDNNIKK